MQVHWDAIADDSTTAYLLNYYMANANVLQRISYNFYTMGLIVTPTPNLDRGFRRLGMYDAGDRTTWFNKSELETIHLY